MTKEAQSLSKKIPLVVFDFDHTIMNQNTDAEVQTIAPGGKIPQDVKVKWDTSEWTEYMKKAFVFLHSNNITKNTILERMKRLTVTPGFEALLSKLYSNIGAEIIIISDSNSVFIDYILNYHNLKGYFSKIYTNPAHWTDNGLLHISPYHHQTHCELSATNMCKGDVLESHIRDNSHKYSFVAYVGDGTNDYCPMLRLSANDLTFVRRDYSLEKYLKRNGPTVRREIVAPLYHWSNGYEILAQVNRKLQSLAGKNDHESGKLFNLKI